MLIAIGSTNPCKIAAVKKIFLQIWPQAKFQAFEVDSGISSQPKGDQETIKGALNRARQALLKTKADFGVGIEGGVKKIGRSLFTIAWCAIVNRKGEENLGGGLVMLLPLKVSQEIFKGGELGPVMDKITGIKEVKKKMGAVGILTKNLVDRTRAYENLVAYALVKFLNPRIY